MAKLRQITTGELYPFMPGLAARDDMEVIHDDPVSAHVEEKNPPKTKKAREVIDLTPSVVLTSNIDTLSFNEDE